MQITDFFSNAGGSSNAFNLTTGAALAQNDTVQMGPDGLGYPVVCTDYAAVANAGAFTSASDGRIVAQTTVISAGSSGGNVSRLAAPFIGVDGSTYRLTHSTGTAGSPLDVAIYRYSTAGNLLGKTPITTAGIDRTNEAYLLPLTNGNLVAIWVFTTAMTLNFAVIDQNMNVVVPATLIEATQSGCVGTLALSGGGFAVCYQQSANRALQRLAIYSNAGAPVLSSTTIQTWSGTAAAVGAAMVELSNQNIVIGLNSNYTTTAGFYQGIFSPAGGIIAAIVNLDSTSTTISNSVGYSVIPGTFCVSRAVNGTNLQKAWVFNNSGVLQGAAFSQATNQVGAFGHKLLNDGVNYYLIWPNYTTSVMQLSRLPVTGTGFASFSLANSVPTTTGGGGGIDAFYERGMIVVLFSSNGTAGQSLSVINNVGFTLKTTTAVGTAASSNGNGNCRLTPCGDFSFIADYEQLNAYGTYFFVGKYANSSILGASAIAAAAGTITKISQNAGSYPSNRMLGSTSKLFDHSAANQYGNKGVLLTNGIVLKGM